MKPACGGVNLNFAPGDLMLISDHINYSGPNYETPAEIRMFRMMGTFCCGPRMQINSGLSVKPMGTVESI